MKEHLKKIFKQPATYKWLVGLITAIVTYFSFDIKGYEELLAGLIGIALIFIFEDSDADKEKTKQAIKDAVKEGIEIGKKAPVKEAKK